MRKKQEQEQGARGLQVPAQVAVQVSAIREAGYNPRVMPAAMMRALKASLVKHGMVLNLVVQKKGSVLIGGHQRLAAMRELCAERGWEMPTELPATVLDVSDSEARQLNVALNNIDGEFDEYKLGALFSEIREEMSDDDVTATGFAPENLDELLKLVSDPEAEARLLEEQASEIPAFATSVTLTIEFATVAERDEARAMLKQVEGRKPGTAVLEALRRARGDGEADDRGAGAGKAERAARGAGRADGGAAGKAGGARRKGAARR